MKMNQILTNFKSNFAFKQKINHQNMIIKWSSDFTMLEQIKKHNKCNKEKKTPDGKIKWLK